MAPRKTPAPVKETWSAWNVAHIVAADMPGIRSLNDKDIRSLARSGILPRFAQRNEDGSNRSHHYSAAEVTVLLTAISTKHAKRTDTVVAVPAPFGAAPKRKRRSRKTTRKAAAPSKSTTSSPAASVPPVTSEDAPA